MFKRILMLALSVSIVLSGNVYSKVAYNLKETIPIAGGITLTNLKRLDSAGWQNINIVEADLDNEYVKANMLTSAQGLNTLETVKTLAEENKTSVAVNGDFFAWNSSDKSKGSALGTIMQDGKLMSSSSETEGMFTFIIDEFNKIFCENIKTDITLKAPNGNELKIKHLNKYDSLAQPVIYTSAFGGVTGGSYNNILEVVIIDDVVTELRTEQVGVEIPQNGYVIRHLPEFDPFLIENLAVGDKVEISFNANFDLSTFKTMTGGGTMLVTQGQPAKITHNVSGANPRTVIACDKTRTKLYLITVDGRQSNAKGYSLSQLADFLIEIGIYDAMNLDGGGSTTLIANQKGEQVLINMPSDNSLRKVASAIGVTSDAPKGKKLSAFEIDVQENKVFKGTTRTFGIKNAVDEYGNPYELELPDIRFEVENGYGYFDKNLLYAQKSGDSVKVYATYDNFTAECEIDILGDIGDIIVTPSHFDLNTNPEIKVVAKDLNGISALIESQDVLLKDVNGFEKNVVVLNKSKKITFSKILYDFESVGFTAKAYPEKMTSKVMLDTINFKSGKSSAKLEYDFSDVSNDQSAAAYLVLNNPVKVSAGEKLGVWVYSPTVLNQWLRVEFREENGNTIKQTLTENIDFSGWKYITFDVPTGAKELTKLYVVQNSFKEKSGGYILFDSLSVAQTEFDNQIINIQKSDASSGQITVSVVADMPRGKTLLSKILSANVMSNIKNSDYVFSLKNYDFLGLDEINVDGYKSFKKGQSLFVTLNNSDGYTSATQWLKFDDDTQKEFKNLFIFLNESHKLIKNNNEEEMLYKKLELLSKKANVYVFYPDYHTNVYKDAGATFVSVGNFDTSSPLSSVKLLDSLLIPKIVINADNAEVYFENLK